MYFVNPYFHEPQTLLKRDSATRRVRSFIRDGRAFLYESFFCQFGAARKYSISLHSNIKVAFLFFRVSRYCITFAFPLAHVPRMPGTREPAGARYQEHAPIFYQVASKPKQRSANWGLHLFDPPSKSYTVYYTILPIGGCPVNLTDWPKSLLRHACHFGMRQWASAQRWICLPSSR